MTAQADTSAERQRLQRQLAAVPDRPRGNPDQLRKLAAELLHEAGKVRSFAHREAAMPGRIVFVSDGALRLYANMSETAKSFSKAHDMLEHAGQRIKQEAERLEHDQAAHDHLVTRLVNQISRLS